MGRARQAGSSWWAVLRGSSCPDCFLAQFPVRSACARAFPPFGSAGSPRSSRVAGFFFSLKGWGARNEQLRVPPPRLRAALLFQFYPEHFEHERRGWRRGRLPPLFASPPPPTPCRLSRARQETGRLLENTEAPSAPPLGPAIARSPSAFACPEGCGTLENALLPAPGSHPATPWKTGAGKRGLLGLSPGLFPNLAGLLHGPPSAPLQGRRGGGKAPLPQEPRRCRGRHFAHTHTHTPR